jgi:hypothetical protein
LKFSLTNAFRPTLNEIREHPFMKMRLPEALPNSILHHSPEWFVNEHGEMIVGPQEGLRYNHQVKPIIRNAHHPLSTFDINKISDLVILGKSEQKAMLNLNTAQGKLQNGINVTKKLSTNFEIFDEEREALPPPKTPKQGSVIEDILNRAASLSIGCRKKLEDPVPRTPHVPKMEDTDVLASMFETLATAIDVAEAQRYTYNHSASVQPTKNGGPSIWVTRYVDYTSKYGLGFLLNDGR